MKLSRIIALSDDNLAEHLDEKLLDTIGADAVEGYEEDLESRREWEEKNADALKLALQYFEQKTFPWPGASSIKYPLVLVSCVQFNARAYPALVPGDRVVDVQKSPMMPLEQSQMAKAIADDMNWQIMSGEWEEGHDLLLMMLPLIGTVFKKTWYDPEMGQNRSYPIHPSNFVVDYWAKSLDTCERKSHVHYWRPNIVKEKVRFGYFRDIEYGKAHEDLSETDKSGDKAKGFEQPAESKTHQFIEQCCWLDLDEDGYAEPYVVTVDRVSKKVARLTDNFKEITLVNKGTRITISPSEYSDDLSFMKVARITEHQYYTKYGFIRSPDGGFYDVGLGTLLSPINHAADSLANQLIDAGTLSNTSGGLLSRNIRIRSGNIQIMPGVWKRTDASGEELRNGVFPWPIKEPSNVLFLLLQLLLRAGQEIGSVTDMMKGQTPGQNTPATTSMSALEQGLQVFSAIYKRIFRSMTEEFRRWYELNKTYGEKPEMYSLDMRLLRPTADPSAVAQAQKLLKAEALANRVAQAPHLYGVKGQHLAERKYLEAINIQNIDEILVPVEEIQPPQDPKALEVQADNEFREKEFTFNSQLAIAKEQRELQRTMSTIAKDRATVMTKLMTAEREGDKLEHQKVIDFLDREFEARDQELKALEIRLNERRLERVAKPSGNEAAA